jgi:hypothetical protein
MKTAPMPVCPKCGGKRTKVVGVEPIFDAADRKRGKPIARLLSCKCACGSRVYTEGHGADVKWEPNYA